MKWETRKRVGGGLTKGHLLKKESPFGGYDSHQGFFGVHWEVQEKYPKSVYLQVEAPRQKDSRTLNRMKEFVIQDLLKSEISTIAEENGLNIQPGSLLDVNSIRNNKSTGVFRIDFSEEDEPKILITKVDNTLGAQVLKVINKFADDITRILR